MLIERRYLAAYLAPLFEVAAPAMQFDVAGLMYWGGHFATPALVDFVMVVDRLVCRDEFKADGAGHISIPFTRPLLLRPAPLYSTLPSL